MDYLSSLLTASTDISIQFTNLTACFDNALTPVVSIGNRGIDGSGFSGGPTVHVCYNSGTSTATWSGHNPVIYNTININYPSKIPSALRPTFQTGVIGCYYTDINSENLYARYSLDDFATEIHVNSGLATGYPLTYVRDVPIQSGLHRPSYQKRIFAWNNSGGFAAYTSREYISFAHDTFENYPEESLSLLYNGYGRWFRRSSFHKTSGTSFLVDQYFYDDFESYSTGSIASFNLGTTIAIDSQSYVGLYLGEISLVDFNWGADDFELYPTGEIFILESGYNFGIRLLTAYFMPSGFEP